MARAAVRPIGGGSGPCANQLHCDARQKAETKEACEKDCCAGATNSHWPAHVLLDCAAAHDRCHAAHAVGVDVQRLPHGRPA